MITLFFLLAYDYSFLPNIEDTIVIQQWYYLGPFSIGPREGVIGVDDRIELDPEYVPDPEREYPSILVSGGFISWQQLSSGDGHINIEYPEVLWDTIQDYYGASGLTARVTCTGNLTARAGAGPWSWPKGSLRSS